MRKAMFACLIFTSAAAFTALFATTLVHFMDADVFEPTGPAGEKVVIHTAPPPTPKPDGHVTEEVGETTTWSPDEGAAAVPQLPFLTRVSGDDPGTIGTAWLDVHGAIHVRSNTESDGAVEMVTPSITVRDRVDGEVDHTYKQWAGFYMSKEPVKVPSWASPAEHNTLRHASIFVSIAAFRDPECATTLLSVLEQASSRHRIYAGISEERRPSDTSCLSSLNLQDTNAARKLLWGDDAPEGLQILEKTITWDDIAGGRSAEIVVTTPMLRARPMENGTVSPPPINEVPQVMYLDGSYSTDTITCLYGELEERRDKYILQSESGRVRYGRGGAQERPSSALAGCRVTTRLTEPENARGPTYGRYITSLFYFNQDYYMVVDSHSRFSVHWDVKMILRTFNTPTRAVLSHYPNGYTPENPEAEYTKRDVMAMCKGVLIANGMPKLGAQWIQLRPQPVLQAFAAAGYMFGDAQFVLDAPFDPFLPYLFDGEEVLYSARMWTSGWDLYCPAEANVFHHYLRPNTPKYWSLLTSERGKQKTAAEDRALYLLRRSHPWAQVQLNAYKEQLLTATKGPNGETVGPSLLPYVPPEERLIVSDDVANEKPALTVEKVYYGMGTKRTLDEYWKFTELSDDFVTTRDNEDRWAGGMSLCNL